MSSKNGSATSVSRHTLEETPNRALGFLRALSTQSVIRATMESAGYTVEDHEEGWKLFFEISGYSPKTPSAPRVNEAEEALGEIQAWEGPWFQRARAALRRKHPGQGEFVFHDLVAGRGAEAIAALALFLDRLDALEDGPERKATRKGDHAALTTLVKRGLTPAMRKHMRQRLDFVRTYRTGASVDSGNDDDDERTRSLAALYLWLQDWSDTARVVVTRKDQQIRLGIARRRAKASKVEVPPVMTAPTPDEDAGPSSRAA